MTNLFATDPLPVADLDVFCCPPIFDEPISEQDAAQAAGIFRALADPTRVRLLSAIAAARPEGLCVCKLVEPLNLSQPTVSHHLKILYEAGLVARARKGTWVYYSLRADALAVIGRAFRC